MSGGAAPVFMVYPPSPNPANPSTTLSYHIPHNSQVQVIIYDILGRKIAVVENGFRNAGTHSTVMSLQIFIDNERSFL